jgi:molybdenum cofactor biosynthesis enzyme MoaA
MSISGRLRQFIGRTSLPAPTFRRWLISQETRLERLRHSFARVVPKVIPAEPYRLEVAITAGCNLRCWGCRYGREFMPGAELPWSVIQNLLSDAKRAGISSIRFYGGEPLLHRDLPKMVAYATELRLNSYVTTNAILLKDKIDALYDAGLRHMTIGFYGVGRKYDNYVQRVDQFRRLEAGLDYALSRYGDRLSLRLNWLLNRQTCSLDDLYEAWDFAKKYEVSLQVDLIHYSLPYFTEGPDRFLQFRPEDKPGIERLVAELVMLKDQHPQAFTQSQMALRSIPDWLLKGPEMRVPCDAYRMLWVGADGSVKLCYVTFLLGNLHAHRLYELLGTREHRKASLDSYRLNCPNCHCHYDSRIQKDTASVKRYS